MSTVTLQPVSMSIPNSFGIYSPDKLKPKKIISSSEFLKLYAPYPTEIHLCFDETPSSDTMLQRSEKVSAYSFGLYDPWYVVARKS